MDLMKDATEEYKASLKRVNPNFDAEYYDNLILEQEELQTPVPEDPIGFNQLDPIRTPGNVAGPSTMDKNVEGSPAQATHQPAA